MSGKGMRFIAFGVIAAALFACAQLERTRDITVVKGLVLRYNTMLIEAAKTGDVEPLKDILLQRERDKLDHWIASWHDSHVYMDGKIENITFKNITLSGNTAQVMTSEDWIYEYRNLKTKQAVLPASDIYYDMEYLLVKQDNTWIITEIKVKSEKKKEEKGNK